MTLLPLLLVPLLAGGALLVWSFFPPEKLNFTRFWAVLNGCTLLTTGALLIDLAWQQKDVNRETGLIWTLHGLPWREVDWLAACWCGLSGVGTVLLLHWPRRQASTTATFRESAAGLWLFPCSVLTAFADGVWLQWAGMMASGWLLCFLLARNGSESTAGNGADSANGAGTCLLWWTVADFVWLFGLLTFHQVWNSPRLSLLSDPKHLEELVPEQISLAVTGQMFLLGSLIVRCGLYPFMSWTRSASGSFRDAAWVALYGIGPGALLFLRWGTMFSSFGEIHLLAAGIGMLSTVLLGLLAVFGTRGPRRLLTIASVQVGMVWMGQVAEVSSLSTTATLVGLSALLLIVVLSLGLDQVPAEQSFARKPRVLVLLAFLLCSGVIGQERLTELVWNADWGTLPHWSLLAAMLAGQLLTSAALFRELRGPVSAGMAGGPVPFRSDVTRSGWIGLGVLTVLSLCGLWLSLLLPFGPGRQVDSIPVVMLVVMLIGWSAAFTWPDKLHSSEQSDEQEDGLLQRMTGNDYYVPLIIRLLVWLPAQGAFGVSQAIERRVLLPLLLWFPASLARWVGDASATADEESSEAGACWSLIAAVVCLFAGIGIARWL